MYAKPPLNKKEPRESYYVTTVITAAEDGKNSDLFWKIVRVRDKAFQYVSLSTEPNTTLFFDPEYSYPYDIALPNPWLVP
jgi:hypothetical protein